MVEVDLRGLLTRIATRRQTATAEEITSEGINGFLSLFLCFYSLGRYERRTRKGKSVLRSSDSRHL